MTTLNALLRRLLPRGIGTAALADLDRELSLRRASRGRHWTDVWWLMREVLVLAPRLWLVKASTAARDLAGFDTDVRLIAKGLTRTPGLSLAAIVVLALGVGAPTAMYSIMSALGRNLPLSEPDQLVSVRYTSGSLMSFPRALTLEEIDVVRRAGALGTVAAYTAVMWDLGSESQAPARVAGARISHDLFDVLGTQPLQGREFVPEDAGESVAVVGERLWRERFGAGPAFLGSTIRLNGEPHTVIGILPARQLFPDGAEIWVPIDPQGALSTLEPPRYATVARLPSAMTLESADAAVRGLVTRVTPTEGIEPAARFLVVSLAARLGVAGPEGRIFAFGMLAMVSCLLLVASANVANLLLCRAIARQHDVAVRTALGAGRARIVASHFAEAGVLATAGGLLGVTVATAATSLFERASAGQLDWWMEVRVDSTMLAFALALTAISTVMAGAVPALRATGRDAQNTLRGDARSGGTLKLSRLSEALVVTEVTLSFALLLSAFLTTLGILDWRRAGDFETREVLAAAYTLRPEQHVSDGERLAFHRTLLERVAERSGVARAAIVAPFPGQADTEGVTVRLAGSEERTVDADPDYTDVVQVSPGAFDVLEAPILRGRDFTWTDGAADPAAVVVNEAFAARFFQGGNPLGRQIRFKPQRRTEDIVATIVGVVPALGIAGPPGRSPDAIYVPLTLSLPQDAFVMLRSATGREPMSLLPELRAALATLDPDKPLHSIGTLASLMRREQSAAYVFGGVFIGSGLAGLLMAGTGLYAIMAFAVGRRRREVGVRVALGASPARVVWAMLRRAAVQLAQGLFLGLVLTILMAPVLAGFSGSSSRGTPVYAYGLVTAVLMATGLIAAIVPMLRAVSIQPIEALRTE